MTEIKIKCPNCGAFNWKYYAKYNGHGCRSCGFLWIDDTTPDGTPLHLVIGKLMLDTQKQRRGIVKA